MLNRAIIMGNLGADPEIRSTQSGKRCANLRVATTERWKDKHTGEQREKTEWHQVTVWSEGLVGIVEQYLRKGSKVYLEGKIQTRKWQDQNGQDRFSTEIILEGFDAKLLMLGSPQTGGPERQARAQPEAERDDPLGDEIPF